MFVFAPLPLPFSFDTHTVSAANSHMALAVVSKKPSTVIASTTPSVPKVPFYSQFTDITSSTWKNIGCGVTSLAMIIDYYKPDAVTVNTLLTQSVALGAYNKDAGWSHQGLVQSSKKYGLDGTVYDLSKSSQDSSFEKFKVSLTSGPVIASVHYKFDPKSSVPHLVVINGIKGDTLYYNDPAAKGGMKEISTADFLKAWKQRYIVVRPTTKTIVT